VGEVRLRGLAHQSTKVDFALVSAAVLTPRSPGVEREWNARASRADEYPGVARG
jgi:hypothetical protein